ncbi:MAG: exodeoxyribonuclease VII small subunit [Lachnospiraceae bacterium]|nr:exodeoxyribonuclease VII small subunit [Lachnospiraceae bacterium]
MAKKEAIDKDITIEEGFGKLNELLADMESENIGLEESFDLYKQGIELVKTLNSKLDDVEGKLNQVSEG